MISRQASLSSELTSSVLSFLSKRGRIKFAIRREHKITPAAIKIIRFLSGNDLPLPSTNGSARVDARVTLPLTPAMLIIRLALALPRPSSAIKPDTCTASPCILYTFVLPPTVKKDHKNRINIIAAVITKIYPMVIRLLNFESYHMVFMITGSCMPRIKNTSPFRTKVKVDHMLFEATLSIAVSGFSFFPSKEWITPEMTTARIPLTLHSSAAMYMIKGVSMPKSK